MMDIASLSTALTNVQSVNGTISDVGVAMLSKQLDLSQSLGDDMIKAMEQSVAPHIGSNFDMSV